MKIELRCNGKLELHLKPETPLETMFLTSMLASAARKDGILSVDTENIDTPDMIVTTEI